MYILESVRSGKYFSGRRKDTKQAYIQLDRASVAQLASKKEENIRELLWDKSVFLIVDEAEVDKQKYINILVDNLDTPNETSY